MREITIKVNEKTGKVEYYNGDKKVGQRTYDTYKYYEVTDKADMSDIYAAIQDYKVSNIWN